MADYNVNMKQWNGNSFDNVLPLAYNSNKFDGKTYSEVSAIFGNCKIQQLQYAGNGMLSVTIVFEFEPKIIFWMRPDSNSGYLTLINPRNKWVSGWAQNVPMNISWDGNTVTLSGESEFLSYAYGWANKNNETYNIVAMS